MSVAGNDVCSIILAENLVGIFCHLRWNIIRNILFKGSLVEMFQQR
jgi:hypothetical protein